MEAGISRLPQRLKLPEFSANNLFLQVLYLHMPSIKATACPNVCNLRKLEVQGVELLGLVERPTLLRDHSIAKHTIPLERLLYLPKALKVNAPLLSTSVLLSKVSSLYMVQGAHHELKKIKVNDFLIKKCVMRNLSSVDARHRTLDLTDLADSSTWALAGNMYVCDATEGRAKLSLPSVRELYLSHAQSRHLPKLHGSALVNELVDSCETLGIELRSVTELVNVLRAKTTNRQKLMRLRVHLVGSSKFARLLRSDTLWEPIASRAKTEARKRGNYFGVEKLTSQSDIQDRVTNPRTQTVETVLTHVVSTQVRKKTRLVEAGDSIHFLDLIASKRVAREYWLVEMLGSVVDLHVHVAESANRLHANQMFAVLLEAKRGTDSLRSVDIADPLSQAVDFFTELLEVNRCFDTLEQVKLDVGRSKLLPPAFEMFDALANCTVLKALHLTQVNCVPFVDQFAHTFFNANARCRRTIESVRLELHRQLECGALLGCSSSHGHYSRAARHFFPRHNLFVKFRRPVIFPARANDVDRSYYLQELDIVRKSLFKNFINWGWQSGSDTNNGPKLYDFWMTGQNYARFESSPPMKLLLSEQAWAQPEKGQTLQTMYMQSQLKNFSPTYALV
jgi:hypothetical protein